MIGPKKTVKDRGEMGRMMEQKLYQEYLDLLRRELVPALGCTEPIAIAYAAAAARRELGGFPDRMELKCSGNIIKNVKGVTVPNSGGMKGLAAAAILGVVGGDPDRELEVLEGVTDAHRARTRELVSEDYCACSLQEGVANLYIAVRVFAGSHWAEVIIVSRHTNIARITRDGEVTFDSGIGALEPGEEAYSPLTLKGILEFANEAKLEDVASILDQQIEMNTAIAREGLSKPYGAQVGRTLLEVYGDNVETRARAHAAAGSDARMSGCPLPVVINSGSGNQGMTVCLPIVEYARELGASKEQLYRALLVANLAAIHQKKFIGSLSAYCGAVSAACGAGAGITYLHGGDYAVIGRTIVNTLANVAGMVCDGAKPSCAAKIASAVEAAILAHHLSQAGHTFHAGEGIVRDDVEETIRSVGYVGRVGMKETDLEILEIMLDHVNLD